LAHEERNRERRLAVFYSVNHFILKLKIKEMTEEYEIFIDTFFKAQKYYPVSLPNAAKQFARKLQKEGVLVMRGNHPGLGLSMDHQSVIFHWKSWHYDDFSIFVDVNLVHRCRMEGKAARRGTEEDLFILLKDFNSRSDE
jgi:hypothetical protein